MRPPAPVPQHLWSILDRQRAADMIFLISSCGSFVVTTRPTPNHAPRCQSLTLVTFTHIHMEHLEFIKLSPLPTTPASEGK